MLKLNMWRQKRNKIGLKKITMSSMILARSHSSTIIRPSLMNSELNWENTVSTSSSLTQLLIQTMLKLMVLQMISQNSQTPIIMTADTNQFHHAKVKTSRRVMHLRDNYAEHKLLHNASVKHTRLIGY